MLRCWVPSGHLQSNTGDFAGGPVVKYLSCKAGDSGSIPGQSTEIPHATEQLSPCISTNALACHNERSE